MAPPRSWSSIPEATAFDSSFVRSWKQHTYRGSSLTFQFTYHCLSLGTRKVYSTDKPPPHALSPSPPILLVKRCRSFLRLNHCLHVILFSTLWSAEPQYTPWLYFLPCRTSGFPWGLVGSLSWLAWFSLHRVSLTHHQAFWQALMLLSR